MSKNNGRFKRNILLLVIVIIIICIVGGLLTKARSQKYDRANPEVLGSVTNINEEESGGDEKVKQEEIAVEKVSHVPIPDAVKAIYMSACVAGTPSFRNDLVELVETTELNSIMIDIKDFSGSISFPTENPNLKPAWDNADCGARDMKDFIASLHEKGIYVIGRVTVFQDPFYTGVRPDLAVQKASNRATWTDNKGLSFIDVGAKEYWDYIIELSNESYEIGFDELNYDYVRFPSDGNMQDIYFPKSQAYIDANPATGKADMVEDFFSYVSDAMRGDNVSEEDTSTRVITSADLFGMVTTAGAGFDLNIGQVLERALPYFDYIAPMVYPSHYPAGFNGYSDPNLYPYELLKYVMDGGVEKVNALLVATTTPASVKENVSVLQLRPWIQDFDYGGNYGPAEVRAQIQGAYDAGLTSWMIWAPSNRYTKAALKAE